MTTRRSTKSVSLSRVNSVIKLINAAGKSLAMIALLPDQTVQLYTKRTGEPAGNPLDAEIDRLITLYGKD